MPFFSRHGQWGRFDFDLPFAILLKAEGMSVSLAHQIRSKLGTLPALLMVG